MDKIRIGKASLPDRRDGYFAEKGRDLQQELSSQIFNKRKFLTKAKIIDS
ncbi:MAG TPA: hypothetical protein VK645_20445 [Chitinophagaceae bacterium]|nr:hypothetical protein [Chitinophagaceae bacterium]